jgi:type IV secretion system protein TrbJ
MKKAIVVHILLLCILTNPAHSAPYVVQCTNCSDIFTQMLSYITEAEQLSEAVATYDELINQTLQNAEMIQQAYDRYSTMLKNTASLPETIKNKLTSEFRELVTNIQDIGSFYGDIGALHQIFDDLYPDYESLANEITSAAKLPDRIAAYRERYEEWTNQANEATKRVFSLTGQQLQDLVYSGEFESQVQELLSTPEGQKEALDAGNQLAGMQLDEARHLRALLATHIQAQQQLIMKEQLTKDVEEEERMQFYETTQDAPDIKLPLGW